MNERKKQDWIDKGYAYVAEKGFDNLTVNTICREVGKSKSSFYHYFGELNQFEDDLLTYHFERAKIFGQKLNNCKNIHPDLVDVVMIFKEDIFFYKQLRIYRNSANHQQYNSKIFKLYEEAVLEKWSIYFGLNNQKIFASKFNKFVTEHFLMSITLENFTHDWISNYLNEVLEMVIQLKKIT